MQAMVLDAPGAPLRAAKLRPPELGPGQLRLRVHACGVCRTDLHIRDGELPDPKLPLVLGHQIVGTVIEGDGEGTRVGVPWLGWTDGYSDVQAAPLLCAGLIGYRSLRFAGDAERLGLYGFGASAHIVAQVARHQGRRVFAFVRRGDESARAFALELGCKWAGWSDEPPPEELDAAVVFAPAGELVPAALRATAKGGVVVCAGIHMSDIPSFPYDILWGERVARSVANL